MAGDLDVARARFADAQAFTGRGLVEEVRAWVLAESALALTRLRDEEGGDGEPPGWRARPPGGAR